MALGVACSFAERNLLRVLIADDHPIVRAGIRAILESHDDLMVVGEAKDAEETVQLALTLEWDVAVIDFAMPGESGVALVQRIKKTQPDRPLLVLSMYPEHAHATQLFKAGATGYVNKDSAGDELANAIRKVARGGKYVSPAFAETLVDELSRGDDRALHEALSERELRVMLLLAEGRPVNEIADELSISSSAVSTYRARILKKLKLNNNADIVRYVAENLSAS